MPNSRLDAKFSKAGRDYFVEEVIVIAGPRLVEMIIIFSKSEATLYS